jgi:hypothetical protein
VDSWLGVTDDGNDFIDSYCDLISDTVTDDNGLIGDTAVTDDNGNPSHSRTTNYIEVKDTTGVVVLQQQPIAMASMCSTTSNGAGRLYHSRVEFVNIPW